MNKKALSPLQSTVILVVVSIIIGIIVMSWGRSYVEKATAQADQNAMKAKQDTLFEDLNTRLQKGEITQEQYDKIKEVILTQGS